MERWSICSTEGESSRLKQTVLELPRGALPVLTLTVIVAICVLDTRLSVYRLTLYGGDVAGFVVGGLAGHWFFASEDVAYRGAFIAGCAAALFLAALDYDHDLFQNMTKFNAAEVGVEFSEQRAERCHQQVGKSAVPRQLGTTKVTIS